MFQEEGDAFRMFVRPQGYTQCVRTETLFTTKLHRAALMSMLCLQPGTLSSSGQRSINGALKMTINVKRCCSCGTAVCCLHVIYY